MNDQFLTELQNVMGGSGIFMQEPMKKHTTFRVGGPADVLVQPDETALAAILALCRQYHVSYSFIGNGSNLLVGDKGIRGVVIEMTDPMGNIEVDGTKITAQAGAMLSKIANTAASNGLGGMEFAAGIPGSVGGAVVMNAGAYGGEMKDIIEKVYVLDENGAQLELDRDALDLGYRHSCIPEKKYIVTKVVLELVPRNEAEIRSEMKELNEKRAEKQPLQYPSAGSTFKRPEGYFAGKLIMDAGLRGYQVGGAQVSEKHCGFVINKGDATAADICQLMRDVSDKVQAQFGVVLEPEVKMIGEF
jgi:UDP-N-acetylmuramate dehydrogenase